MRQIFQRPDRKNAEYSTVLQDLQQSTGQSIIFSIFIICLVLFFAGVITLPFSWSFWLVMGIALSSCAGASLLLNRSIWISHIVLIAGLLAATFANTTTSRVMTVALNNLAGSYVVQWNVQMAGALMAALPTLVVYILLSRYFMRGLLSGALKG
jgi:hypothetical protein